MSAVRPEFGPTLPELLGPRLRVLPRVVRLALGAVAALVVLAALWALLLRGGGAGAPHGIVVHRPIAFNFIYARPFHKRAPLPGELARVGGNRQALAVRELRLPAYRGDASAFLPFYAAKLEIQMGRQLPGFLWRADGKANVNGVTGYEIIFQYRPHGKLTFGRRVLLLPTSTSRQGVDLLLTAPFTPAVGRADAVGRNGPLKTSLRSFRFGTQRP